MSSKLLAVEEVFTPTIPAVLTFVEREKVNDRLVDALRTPGKQIIVYGHSGCGKTTLLENKLKETYEFHYTSRCTAEATLQSLVTEALGDLCPMALSETEVGETQKHGAEFSAPGVSPKVISSKETATKSKRSAVVRPGPSIRLLANEIGKRKGCWVLEDFHKMAGQEKLLLAQSMKMFMDMAAEYPALRVVAIGAVDTARQVVDYDAEMKNRVSEIAVPLMTQEELSKVIEKGEELLNVEFDFRARDGIVALSNGLASACHQLCLNMCRLNSVQVSQLRRVSFDLTQYRAAIQAYVEESSDSLKADFDKATKQLRAGKFQNGELILRALLKFGQDGATHAQLLAKIREKSISYPASNLTTYLGTMQREERGGLIRFDEDSNRFSFKEPVARAYAHSLFEVNDRQTKRGQAEVSARINELVNELLTLTQSSRSKK